MENTSCFVCWSVAGWKRRLGRWSVAGCHPVLVLQDRKYIVVLSAGVLQGVVRWSVAEYCRTCNNMLELHDENKK